MMFVPSGIDRIACPAQILDPLRRPLPSQDRQEPMTLCGPHPRATRLATLRMRSNRAELAAQAAAGVPCAREKGGGEEKGMEGRERKSRHLACGWLLHVTGHIVM